MMTKRPYGTAHTNDLQYGMRYRRIGYYQSYARRVMREQGQLANIHLFRQPWIRTISSAELGRAVIGLAAVMTTEQLVKLLEGKQ
jgi:hypothetical protein